MQIITSWHPIHLAREIHDELGQQLAAIKVGIGHIQMRTKAIDGLEERFNSILGAVDQTIQSLRKIATELRPAILDTLGLIPSIDWLIKEFARKNEMKCDFDIDVENNFFEKDISICFFRICQEALTNIGKHANATNVNVKVHQKNEVLNLKIQDNGVGIDNEKLNNPFSMGLVGMRERANLASADLQIISKKNQGTIVELVAKVS